MGKFYFLGGGKELAYLREENSKANDIIRGVQFAELLSGERSHPVMLPHSETMAFQ